MLEAKVLRSKHSKEKTFKTLVILETVTKHKTDDPHAFTSLCQYLAQPYPAKTCPLSQYYKPLGLDDGFNNDN